MAKKPFKPFEKSMADKDKSSMKEGSSKDMKADAKQSLAAKLKGKRV